jgi:hypothetical protein
MYILALLGIVPTDKNALRFLGLLRHNATHIRALVTKWIGVAKYQQKQSNSYIRW